MLAVGRSPLGHYGAQLAASNSHWTCKLSIGLPRREKEEETTRNFNEPQDMEEHVNLDRRNRHLNMHLREEAPLALPVATNCN